MPYAADLGVAEIALFAPPTEPTPPTVPAEISVESTTSEPESFESEIPAVVAESPSEPLDSDFLDSTVAPSSGRDRLFGDNETLDEVLFERGRFTQDFSDTPDSALDDFRRNPFDAPAFETNEIGSADGTNEEADAERILGPEIDDAIPLQTQN